MPFVRYFSLLILSVLLPLTAVAGPNFSSDYLQSLPEIKMPKAGSLQGSLSKFNPAVSELSQGSLSIPLAMGVDQSRGPLLVNPFPSYSIHNGLSEWGQGLEVALDIHRYREIGDLNFADDDFVSPWGILVKGSDGSWYPKGLKAAVKVEISDVSARAILPDGSIWFFAKAIPSANPSAPYGFVLTEITSLVGDKTLLTWQDGTRPLLTEIRYGSKDTATLPYSIRLNYEALPKDNLSYSYRSKRLAQITSRIQSVQFFDLPFSTVKARWSYTLSHEYSAYSPSFYLKSYQKTYASGAVEPSIQLSWSRFDDFIKTVKPAPTNRIDSIVQDVNVGGVSSRGLSFFDYDNDGLVDIESAKTHRIYRQKAGGFEQIADYEAIRDWQPCLPPDAVGNFARRIVRLTGPYSRPLVFMNLVGSGSAVTRLLACELDGHVVYDENLNVDFSQNALVAIGDLNGDQKPDLVKVTPASIEILENVSNGDQIKFKLRSSFAIEGGSLETNLAVVDINGDGIPDLFMHEGSSGRAFFGKGNFEFTKKYTVLPYHDGKDQSYDVGSRAAVNFVDANSDGLTDLAISNGREFYLLMNLGLRFKAAPVPFTEGLSNEGEALTVNILGSGNPMVFRSSGAKDVRGMELSNPGVGLLKAVDDGQGNLVSFEFSWQNPEKAKIQLQKQLTKITKDSLGKGRITLDLQYGISQLGAQKPYLLGYDTVSQKSPLLESAATFKHPEESPGLLTALVQTDRTGSLLEKVNSNDYASSVVRGVTVWLKTSESAFSRLGSAASGSYTKNTGYQANSLCVQTETLKMGGDSLISSFKYAEISGVEEGLGCPLASAQREGHHQRKDFDFVESVQIDLDAWGLPLAIRQLNGSETRVVQQMGYDELHRLVELKELSGLKHTFTYQGDSLLLDGHETSIGVKTAAAERYPNGLLKTHVTTRGEGDIGYRQSLTYDGYERLIEQRDNLYDDPLKTFSYTFGSSKAPGFIRTVDIPATSINAQSDEYFAADGSPLARILSLDTGNVIAKLQSFDDEKGYSASYAVAEQGDDFASSWQAYQNQIAKKSEVFVDGWDGLQIGHQTHQVGQVETLASRFLLLSESLTQQRVSNERFETLVRRDAMNRIIGRRDELKNWTLFQFDMAGRLREVQLADGSKQEAQFDNFGQLIHMNRSKIGSIEYFYDERGLLQKKTIKRSDGSLDRIVQNSYDIHGRVNKTSNSSNGQEISFSFYYDGYTSTPEFYPYQKGFASAVLGEHFEKRMQFDIKGRLVKKSEWLTKSKARKVSEFTYYANDFIRSNTTSVESEKQAQHSVIEQVLQADGLLKSVKLNGLPFADLHYDELGLLKSAELNERRWIVDFHYDPVTSEVQAYEAQSQGYRVDYHFERSSRGLIDAEQISGISREYRYDDRAFLVSSDQESFTYDMNGLINAEPQTMKGYVFDSQGRLIQKSGMSLAYDSQGQVTLIQLENGSSLSYGYDEDGLRNMKFKNGAFQQAIFSGTLISKDQILEVFKIGNIVVGYFDNGTFRPLLGDLRGSIIDDGKTAQPISVYGKRTDPEGWQEIIDFAGHPRDSDTGLVRMGVRDYDPDLKKFLQPDFLFIENIDRCAASPVECSLYSYAKNNPLSYTDPSGNFAIFIPVVIEGVATAATGAAAVGAAILSYPIVADATQKYIKPAFEATKEWVQQQIAPNKNLSGVGLGSLPGKNSTTIGPMSSIKPIETFKSPTILLSSAVTQESIAKALQGDTTKTLQGSVSIPAIQRYVDKINLGEKAPPIKMDGDIIVDGNHRYIAGKLTGVMPEVQESSAAPSQMKNARPIQEIQPKEEDWGNQ